MSSTCSNYEDESVKQTTNRAMAFTRKYESRSDSSDEDISDKYLAKI